jgi:GntR family transcriptional regulator / MocR family aminotransferase
LLGTMNRAILQHFFGPIGSILMSKNIRSLDLALNHRPKHTALSQWLYEELRRAVLDRRLAPGTRLPATRDFALQYGVSRGTVVTVFEQLQAEGYLVGKAGVGTKVNELLPKNALGKMDSQPRIQKLPAVMQGLPTSHPARPFRPYEPALREFPTDIWARVTGRRLRRASSSLLAGGDPRGYAPLREVIAAYLGSSRGVNCSADSVVILSGAQQGLDLLARILTKPGDSIWMEDPGYFGATIAFRNAGARIISVPVDEFGLVVAHGKESCHPAKAVYVTPAHQCPLGMTMSFERRLALLEWAHNWGAFIIEDDYDSEYRFEGRPVPALQGLDKSGSVIFLGSFSKVLFPSLRLGYAVLPPPLMDPVLALRVGVDICSSTLHQAVLCDFMVEGHFGRHIRRMREMYAGRLAALQDEARRYLGGLLDISTIQAGLSAAGFLRNGMTSRQAERVAVAHGIEVLGLDRFELSARSVAGLLVGFAAFTEREIRRGVVTLAAALERSVRDTARIG